jgi:hypothetical protein
MAETQSGSVQESPMRWKPHARKRKDPLRFESEYLNFLTRIRLRIVDSNLKHWETLLQLFSTCPGAVPSGKLGFQSAIHFKRVAGSWQFTGGCNHVVPIKQ